MKLWIVDDERETPHPTQSHYACPIDNVDWFDGKGGGNSAFDDGDGCGDGESLDGDAVSDDDFHQKHGNLVYWFSLRLK